MEVIGDVGVWFEWGIGYDGFVKLFECCGVWEVEIVCVGLLFVLGELVVMGWIG